MITVTPEQYTALLQAAFAQLHDPADWKGPIDCVVPWRAANVYMDAVEFMTGVRPQVASVGPEKYRLTCVGYRNGPAGP